jgi:hypothetical protein
MQAAEAAPLPLSASAPVVELSCLKRIIAFADPGGQLLVFESRAFNELWRGQAGKGARWRCGVRQRWRRRVRLVT